MTSYIALLRGVNVGGKVAKMETVRASFEALGFEEVATYVQSGNVLFQAKAAGESALAKKIAARLEKDIGFSPGVLVLSAADLARCLRWAEAFPERMREMGEFARADYQARFISSWSYSTLFGERRRSVRA